MKFMFDINKCTFSQTNAERLLDDGKLWKVEGSVFPYEAKYSTFLIT